MPKDYFKLDQILELNDLAIGAKIHVIGICGVAMGQLAVELSKRNYQISGSDKEFYEPIKSLLEAADLKCYHGYHPDNLADDLDLVIIGNAVSYDNPEVQEVERRGLAYSIFPKLLHDFMIKGRHSIVVSGTHGKTTTTALTAALLNHVQADPSYFVGGISNDLPASLKRGNGKFSVVEGDEYDSSFFAKVPKFSFYQANSLIINAIEYDHADIYSDLNAIKNEFTNLMLALTEKDQIFACTDFPVVQELILNPAIKAKIITFGTSAADAQIIASQQHGLTQEFTYLYKNQKQVVRMSLPGVYNARNALASLLVLSELGFSQEKLLEGLAKLKGAKRRQEVRFNTKNLVLIEDFAHHPTAVAEAIKAVKNSFPDHQLISVFEPRSNTSRKKVFQTSYINAFSASDLAIISQVQVRSSDLADDLLDVKDLVIEINKSGKKCLSFENSDLIYNFLINDLSQKKVILVMSNGAFGGLINKLQKYFTENVHE